MYLSERARGLQISGLYFFLYSYTPYILVRTMLQNFRLNLIVQIPELNFI